MRLHHAADARGLLPRRCSEHLVRRLAARRLARGLFRASHAEVLRVGSENEVCERSLGNFQVSAAGRLQAAAKRMYAQRVNVYGYGTEGGEALPRGSPPAMCIIALRVATMVRPMQQGMLGAQ